MSRPRFPVPKAAIVTVLCVTVLGVTVLAVAGCSTSPASTDTTPAPASTAATGAASIVPLAADCTEGALERDLGALGYSACADEWASVMPASYTAVCTECESTWLARWDGTGWRLVAQCHAYAILTEDVNGCAAVEGSFPDPSPREGAPVAIPPAEIACEIWGYNTLEENLATTGCEPG